MDFNVPNHFIDLGSVKTENIDFEEESDKLRNILDFAQKENDVQQYIKQNKKWFIPAALFRDYDFGHHSAYLVPEQSLGAEYKADYMLLGNNSIGHQIILVEFEDVNVDFKILTANSETASVRKGLTQIRDWKRWMDDHRIYFLILTIPPRESVIYQNKSHFLLGFSSVGRSTRWHLNAWGRQSRPCAILRRYATTNLQRKRTAGQTVDWILLK